MPQAKASTFHWLAHQDAHTRLKVFLNFLFRQLFFFFSGECKHETSLAWANRGSSGAIKKNISAQWTANKPRPALETHPGWRRAARCSPGRPPPPRLRENRSWRRKAALARRPRGCAWCSGRSPLETAARTRWRSLSYTRCLRPGPRLRLRRRHWTSETSQTNKAAACSGPYWCAPSPVLRFLYPPSCFSLSRAASVSAIRQSEKWAVAGRRGVCAAPTGSASAGIKRLLVLVSLCVDVDAALTVTAACFRHCNRSIIGPNGSFMAAHRLAAVRRPFRFISKSISSTANIFDTQKLNNK